MIAHHGLHFVDGAIYESRCKSLTHSRKTHLPSQVSQTARAFLRKLSAFINLPASMHATRRHLPPRRFHIHQANAPPRPAPLLPPHRGASCCSSLMRFAGWRSRKEIPKYASLGSLLALLSNQISGRRSGWRTLVAPGEKRGWSRTERPRRQWRELFRQDRRPPICGTARFRSDSMP